MAQPHPHDPTVDLVSGYTEIVAVITGEIKLSEYER